MAQRRGPSASLLARKLGGSAAKIAWTSDTSRGGRIEDRHHTRIQAVHCLRVATDLTLKGCCINGWCRQGHGRRSLIGLSEKFSSERRAANRDHNKCKRNTFHDRSPPAYVDLIGSIAAIAEKEMRKVTQMMLV